MSTRRIRLRLRRAIRERAVLQLLDTLNLCARLLQSHDAEPNARYHPPCDPRQRHLFEPSDPPF